MNTRSNDVAVRLVKFLNVILMALPMAAAWALYYQDQSAVHMAGTGLALVTLLFVTLYMVYGRIYEAFLLSIVRISDMVYGQCLAALMSDGLMYVIFCLLSGRLPNVLPMAAVFAAQLALSAAWSSAAHIWYFKTFPPQNTAVIYGAHGSVETLIDAYGLGKKFRILYSESVEDCLGRGMDRLRQVQTVFLYGIHSHERNALLKYCIEHNIMVYVLPRIGDIIMSGASPMHLFHLPFLRVGRYRPAPEQQLLKRLFDILVSGLALIILSPVMLVTALAIKLTDGGPVFYRQKRLTKDRKEFYVLKFRSMRQDAEKDGVARLSTGDRDDRITPVGRVIRKLRIDELPQLLNILGGSMSIVGPRPERPEIAEQYEQVLPEFSLRLQAKAGLTGYAQVYGKYNTTPYDKLQMDLMYIAHPSLWEDLRIIFATIKILFIPESTEGVAEGMQTAMGVPAEAPGEERKEKVEV